jgi:hypothetical protein
MLESDNLPYPVDRPPHRPCPGCGKSLPVDVVVCVSCGFHLGGSEKLSRTFQVVRRYWDAGLPMGTRFKIFLALQAVELALIYWLARDEGNWALFLIPWVGFTVLLGFVLGTFDRLTVARSERGQVHLRRRWHVCFLPRRQRKVPWHEYDEVVTGRTREGGCLAWMVILGLVPLGVLPAILWWHYFVHSDSYFLALVSNYNTDLLLYRGKNEERTEEMATVLQDTTGLKWRRN